MLKLRVKQAEPAVLDALGALGPLVRDDLLALTALTGPERAPRGLGLSNRVLSLP